MFRNCYFLLLSVLCISDVMYSATFLWEYRSATGERSCCLHLEGVDICNPHVPCTHFAYVDLSGILQYVKRVINTEYGKTEPHKAILTKTHQFLIKTLENGYQNILYQNRKVSHIRFYHEIAMEDFNKPKDAKKDTQTQNKNAIAAHLARLNLVQPLRG